MKDILARSIEFIKGIGPERAKLLQKELGIFTLGDLLQHFPYRYEDRSQFYSIEDIDPTLTQVQLVGKIISSQTIGHQRNQRLVCQFSDGKKTLELIWFKGIKWMMKSIKVGNRYIVVGKPKVFGRKFSLAHPELIPYQSEAQLKGYLQPLYPTTESLKKRYIHSHFLFQIFKNIIPEVLPFIPETLPHSILTQYQLISKSQALQFIHLPLQTHQIVAAKRRLKFEELFFIQLQILHARGIQKNKNQGIMMKNTALLSAYYQHHLPFALTSAQKKVMKEIYKDLQSGKQMNRLVQGDVGSGKTMVAFLSMLISIGSATQCAFMTPTEILAEQHFKNLRVFCEKMHLTIALLTGSTKAKERKQIWEDCKNGNLNILVGTHALLEEKVQFHHLGLAIIDEQHRFGVVQRSKLWKKNRDFYPHVLIMTATPIPRTLSMTLYGDLDVSIIDELPQGRKPIKTLHFKDNARLKMYNLLAEQIQLGRQAYLVYPLIEESNTLHYKHLLEGKEIISKAFPNLTIGMIHGRMHSEEKESEMKKFINKETHILVATTVIEVGVDVPNASVMVIENAEKFGLSQLHQLRGRVGRGPYPSYCILMSDLRLTKEAKLRLKTMVSTNDGFEISEMDMKLRGPGNMMGTQQSGTLDMLIADITQDGEILKHARMTAQKIIQEDPKFELKENKPIREHINSLNKGAINWGRIS